MRLENIHLSFDPRGIAGLHGLNLQLHTGEILAVMGASGAGKSTLLRVLSGEAKPAKGEIIHTARVALMDMHLHTHHTGSIQTWLMSGVKRNLDDEKKLQLARDLADAFEFPMQLQRKLTEVSEGQRQRARLAFALIDFPELLLLDEPFAHLDAPLRAELMVLLKNYVKQREITVVWVTHDRNEALSLSDRLGVLNFGKWEQLGPAEEVFWRPKSLVVAKLMGHQNLITVSRNNPQEHWSTPFGGWNSQGVGLTKSHLVLSLPPSAFTLNPQGAWSGTVVEKRFLGHQSELHIECHNHKWAILWDKPGLMNVQVGEIHRFNVELSQGVAIDCL